MHRKRLDDYFETMWRSTDRVMLDWSTASGPVDMLVEMRRIALLIVMETLFRVDMMPDLDRLFPVMLDVLRYISPGLWTVLPQAPRPGFTQSLAEMDAYLYKIIAERRADGAEGDDLLGLLIGSPGMDDDLIRDQMLTLLIAGHDTSTALLAWTLYVLGAHPDVARRVGDEVDERRGEPYSHTGVNGPARVYGPRTERDPASLPAHPHRQSHRCRGHRLPGLPHPGGHARGLLHLPNPSPSGLLAGTRTI